MALVTDFYVMFKKLEEIIEDHRRRNRQTIIVVLVAFFIVFLLFNVGFAFWVLQRGPSSKVDALLSWNPMTSQYVFFLIELLMLFWWVWLFLSYKLLQMRISLVSDHIIEDYKEGQIGIKEPKPWEKIENHSFFTKQIGSKILLAMTALLFLSTFFHLGRHAIPVISSLGLIAYGIASLIRGKKIETFIREIPQTYTTVSTSGSDKTNRYLIFGLFFGLASTIAVDQLAHFNIYDMIFFFLAFSSLFAASSLLGDITNNFMAVVRIADSARASK